MGNYDKITSDIKKHLAAGQYDKAVDYHAEMAHKELWKIKGEHQDATLEMIAHVKDDIKKGVNTSEDAMNLMKKAALKYHDVCGLKLSGKKADAFVQNLIRQYLGAHRLTEKEAQKLFEGKDAMQVLNILGARANDAYKDMAFDEMYNPFEDHMEAKPGARHDIAKHVVDQYKLRGPDGSLEKPHKIVTKIKDKVKSGIEDRLKVDI